MDIDRSAWSGEGDLTAVLLEALCHFEQVAVVKVLDAPTSRAEAGFNFIGNDVFVGFRRQRGVGIRRYFGLVPLPVIVYRKSLTLDGLATALREVAGVGEPDYADAEMLQYLRTERVIPPYQKRGQKVVEVVRVFEATAL
jgi:hypothetical protein